MTILHSGTTQKYSNNFDDIFAHGELSGIEHKFVERDKTDDMVETIKQGYLTVSRLNDKY